MTQYRKIVFTTDLSEESWSAFPEALDLARKYGAELITLCVVVDPAHFNMSELYSAGNVFADLDKIRRDALATAEKVIEEHLADHPSVTHRVICGKYPPKAIVDEAADLGADLIVMSTHGRTGLSHVLLGSTTERVVRCSSIPVLTIRAPKVPVRS